MTLQTKLFSAGLPPYREEPYIYYTTQRPGVFYEVPNALYVIKIQDKSNLQQVNDLEIGKEEADYFVSSMREYTEKKHAYDRQRSEKSPGYLFEGDPFRYGKKPTGGLEQELPPSPTNDSHPAPPARGQSGGCIVS